MTYVVCVCVCVAVSDWDVVQGLWDQAVELLSLNLEEHPVLVTEPVFNTKSLREKYAEVMFENYKVPGLFICKTPVLSW